MKYFADCYQNIHLLNWEMMKLNDKFGQVMIRNFEQRGCDLLGIQEYPDVPALIKRFEALGYQNNEVYDMLTVYDKYINKDEKTRIEKIEWLDELEEWNLIQRHYYLALCSKISDTQNSAHISIKNSN